MTHRKFIVAYFVFLLACCLVRSLNFFATVMVWLFFPLLGVVIIHSYSALFYSVLLLPTVLAISGGSRNVPLSICGFLFAVIAAVLPGWLGGRQYEEMKYAFRASDVSFPTQAQPKSFKLTGYDIGYDTPQCRDLCSDLLLKSNVEAVYIAKRRSTGYSAFRIGNRGKCSLQHGLDPERSGCLIRTDGNSGDTDVEIVRVEKISDPKTSLFVEKNSSCVRGRQFAVANPDRVGAIEIYERVDGKLKLAERMTMFAAHVAPLPFSFLDVSCGQSSARFHVASSSIDTEKSETRELLQRRYGLSFKAEK